MDLLTHISQAFTNLLSSKLRSCLAVLGILVGTGSVVCLIMSGQLATEHALAQFKKLGTNLISVNISVSSSDDKQKPRAFQLDDIPAVLNSSRQIKYIAPYTQQYGSFHFYLQQASGQVIGATRNLLHTLQVPLFRGRFISTLDGNSPYCMVGYDLAKKIYKRGKKPIGSQILVGSTMFTVVGILNKWKPNFFFYSDINSGIVVSIPASYSLGRGDTKIDNILVRLVKDADLNQVKQSLLRVFSQLIPKSRLSFRDPSEIIGLISESKKTFTMMLASIGAISLVVGGIGVMNIMLVSVIERRREIGVRMAIGAKPYDIWKMFLIESIILTLFGGLLGVMFGMGIALGIAYFSGWEFHFYLVPPTLGFSVSVLVGIFSGFYPAMSASKLDPIETLASD